MPKARAKKTTAVDASIEYDPKVNWVMKKSDWFNKKPSPLNRMFGSEGSQRPENIQKHKELMSAWESTYRVLTKYAKRYVDEQNEQFRREQAGAQDAGVSPELVSAIENEFKELTKNDPGNRLAALNRLTDKYKGKVNPAWLRAHFFNQGHYAAGWRSLDKKSLKKALDSAKAIVAHARQVADDNMEANYRDAQKKLAEAEKRMLSAKTRKEKQEATAEWEFWDNKAAYYGSQMSQGKDAGENRIKRGQVVKIKKHSEDSTMNQKELKKALDSAQAILTAAKKTLGMDDAIYEKATKIEKSKQYPGSYVITYASGATMRVNRSDAEKTAAKFGLAMDADKLRITKIQRIGGEHFMMYFSDGTKKKVTTAEAGRIAQSMNVSPTGFQNLMTGVSSY